MVEKVATDHLTVFAQFRIQRVPSYEAQNYSYFHLTEEGDSRFGQWLDTQDWNMILGLEPDIESTVDKF